MSSPNQAVTSAVSATQTRPRQHHHVIQRHPGRGIQAQPPPSRVAISQDRNTCSIGWPIPRSVASEKAPTSSASRTPESRKPKG
jgi:hypothetical protein